MRLALFVSAPRGGGAQRRLSWLAPALAAAGFEVDLVTAAGTARPGAGVRAVALQVTAADWPWIGDRRGLWVPLALPALARYLDEVRPEVLLSTSLPANLTALAAARRSRHRPCTIITLNLHMRARLASLGRLGRLLARAVRRSFQRADAIIAISEGVADDARSFLGAAAPPVFTVYNPIDAATVAELACAPPTIPLPEQRPLLVACGKLQPQKDFDTLLRAFALFRRRTPASLVILGEGPARRHLERLVRQLELSADVRLPGFVDNPFAIMAAADLFVLSSRFEGLSNVLLEALACGCRIVATDCPSGPRELLADGRYGLLVPPGDPAALAEAMSAALAEPHDARAARRRAAAFSVADAVAGYVGAIRQVYEAGAASRQRRPLAMSGVPAR